jgi:hypothetical protein
MTRDNDFCGICVYGEYANAGKSRLGISSDYLASYAASLSRESGKGGRIADNELVRAMDSKLDFGDIFRIVKRSVYEKLRKERPGVGLILANLPNELGAFWEIGGNYIVLNSVLVNAMRAASRSETEFNSFVFTILAHEYIHSLGYVDELEARRLTASVAVSFFGEGHPACVMASGDLWEIYPFLKFVPSGNGSTLNFVRNFDIEQTRDYIR